IGRSSGPANGLFVNNGTVSIETGRLDLQGGDNRFENYGLFELTGNNAQLNLISGPTGSFLVAAGSTFNVNPGTGNLAIITTDGGQRPLTFREGIPLTCRAVRCIMEQPRGWTEARWCLR